jgi:hypothetical protein
MASVGLVEATVKLGRVRSPVCASVSSGRAQLAGAQAVSRTWGVPCCGAPREWEPHSSSALSRLDAGPRSRDRGGNGSKDQRTERAASRISRVVASGCEIIATCDALTSTTVACARAAMNRSVAGGMAWSCVATMYHDGIVFHAGSPDSDWNASFENGRCVACISPVISSGRSAPNASHAPPPLDFELETGFYVRSELKPGARHHRTL